MKLRPEDPLGYEDYEQIGRMARATCDDVRARIAYLLCQDKHRMLFPCNVDLPVHRLDSPLYIPVSVRVQVTDPSCDYLCRLVGVQSPGSPGYSTLTYHVGAAVL